MLPVFRVPFWFNQQYCAGFNTDRFVVNALGNNNQFPYLHSSIRSRKAFPHTSINNHEQFIVIVMVVPDEFPLGFHQFYLVIIELGKKFVEMKLVYQTGNNTDIK